MTIAKNLENGRLVLKVAGRLDTNTSPELEAELDCGGASEIVFDFSGLEYMSSAGLTVLMSARKAVAPAGGKVSIASPNEMVKGVLEMTGLDGVFDIL